MIDELIHERSFKALDDTLYAVNPNTLSNYRAGYITLWDQAEIRETAAASRWAKKIISGKAIYVDIERATGVPWWVIGALHMRESGCDFHCVLHNGERIIGTGRKTTLVPKGRGPFTSFKQAAIDALKDYSHIRVWGVAEVAFIFESFNGFGYRRRGIPSPYLWGGSSVQKRGKFVSDGVYDPNTWDSQLGGMTVLKALAQLDPGVADAIAKPRGTQSTPSVPKGTTPVATSTLVATIMHYAGIALPYALAAGAVILAGYVVWRILNRKKAE